MTSTRRLLEIVTRLQTRLPERHREACDAEWRGISWRECKLCEDDRKVVEDLRAIAAELE